MGKNNFIINDAKSVGSALIIIRKYLKIPVLELSYRIKKGLYVIPENISLPVYDFYEMCLELLEKEIQIKCFALTENNEYKEISMNEIKLLIENNNKTRGVLFDDSQFISYTVMNNSVYSNDEIYDKFLDFKNIGFQLLKYENICHLKQKFLKEYILDEIYELEDKTFIGEILYPVFPDYFSPSKRFLEFNEVISNIFKINKLIKIRIIFVIEMYELDEYNEYRIVSTSIQNLLNTLYIETRIDKRCNILIVDIEK